MQRVRPRFTAHLYALLLVSSIGCSGNWDVARKDASVLDDASMQGAQGEDAEGVLGDEDASVEDPAEPDADAPGVEEPAIDADLAADAALAGDAAAGSHCGDGMRDAKEACDDGDANSDSAPDACRTSCALPRCGDGVTDRGEECDDANQAWGDRCFECSRRHYFILNQPSSNSTGDDSIVRADRRGHSQVIVGPDPSLNGIREIEIGPDGKVLYAVQANFGLMQNRILLFDPLTGAQRDQIKLDTAALGYDGSPTAMALGLNDLLYVVVHDNAGGEVKLISVDPASKALRPIMSLGPAFSTLRLTRDESGGLYLSTSKEIKLIQPAFTRVESYATLEWVAGLAYDAASGSLWAATSQPPMQIVRFTGFSERETYATLPSSVPVGGTLLGGRALLIEPDGLPLVTIDFPSKVVAVQANGSMTDVWTTNLELPGDISVVEFKR